ncbi:MAG: SDR family oxidoreductase [Deltaproteobacteria bacterium]|nr:SDR family oxidoreductase [Deltaproteobacteria bacterium]
MFSLKDKIAMITGGASGIGLAVAKRFVLAGAKVIIADLQDGTAIADEIGAHFMKLDVSDENQVAETLEDIEKRFGKLDVLINNAGIAGKDGVMIEDGEADLLKKVFEINTFGVFYGLKYGPRHMNDGGAIINTASQAIYTMLAGSGPYSASKAAVANLTKMAAVELGHRGIRVNAVCPTFTQTPMMVESAEYTPVVEQLVPMGRAGETEDLAGVYHFLAAPESAFVTGQTLVVDGGWSCGPSMAVLDKLMG